MEEAPSPKRIPLPSRRLRSDAASTDDQPVDEVGGTVHRKFIERLLERFGGDPASSKVLDSFTNSGDGTFRRDDFLQWLYDSDVVPRGADVPPTSASLPCPPSLQEELGLLRLAGASRPPPPPLFVAPLPLAAPSAGARQALISDGDATDADGDARVPTPQLASGGTPPSRAPGIACGHDSPRKAQAPLDDCPAPLQPPLPRFVQDGPDPTSVPNVSFEFGGGAGRCAGCGFGEQVYVPDVVPLPLSCRWEVPSPGSAWDAHTEFKRPPRLHYAVPMPPLPPEAPMPLLQHYGLSEAQPEADGPDPAFAPGSVEPPYAPPPVLINVEQPKNAHFLDDDIANAAVQDPSAGPAPASGSPRSSASGEGADRAEAGEGGEPQAIVDEGREWRRALLLGISVLVFWTALLLTFILGSQDFPDPVCLEDRTAMSCEPCGQGLVFLPLFGEWERSWPSALKVILYFLGMMWLFQGIGVVCDKFMEGIEEMTSTEQEIWVDLKNGAHSKRRKRVWNGTIANLTLMALGSSAPEILLNIIETSSGNFFAGELGPSTIVGSAAFNLLIITAVCICAIPDGETRHVLYLDVFVVTCVFSLFAYLWMVLILQVITPDLVERWEAAVTLLMFPLMLVMAYAAERGWLFRPLRTILAESKLEPIVNKVSSWTRVESLKTLSGKVSPMTDKAISGKEQVGDDEVVRDTSFCRLSFVESEVYFTKSSGTLPIRIVREQGLAGRAVSCEYKTKAGSAVSREDFKPVKGRLHFEDGVKEQVVDLEILQNASRASNSSRFKLYLTNVSEGAKFDGEDPDPSRCSCEIILEEDFVRPSISSRVISFSHNGGSFSLCLEEWRGQFVSALYCQGSAQEQAAAGVLDWVLHFFGMPWKVLAAFAPPTDVCGGWLCFIFALLLIGVVTAAVGDIASLLGCSTGFMSDDITAITLVALGTSLPDTVASKLAAQQDDTADNAIGNVTGSNSVNVFLGVGIPYTMAAFYWSSEGVTDAWRTHPFRGSTYAELYESRYPSGGFIVPSHSVGFSVLIFSVIAIVAIAMLMFRRLKYGGELGGPKMAQYRDAAILASLWVIFLVVVIMRSLSG